MPDLHILYLALGANIGDREQTMNRAIELIEGAVGTVVRRSSFIETEPWGFLSSNRFINAAVCVHTALSTFEVLRATQNIEKQLGRTVKSSGGEYHDRPIDIDILLYDDIHVDTPELCIPHPLMHERDFVMIPLREIMDGEGCIYECKGR